MGNDDKWAKVINYLNTTDAKAESVLNLIKNTWKPKGKKIVKTDDFNRLRRAWTLMTVAGIYNKQGTPKNKLNLISLGKQKKYFTTRQELPEVMGQSKRKRTKKTLAKNKRQNSC